MNLRWGGARSGRRSPPGLSPPRCCFSPWARVARPSACLRVERSRTRSTAAVVSLGRGGERQDLRDRRGRGRTTSRSAAFMCMTPPLATWAARADMPTARALFGASAVGGTIYAIGGTTIGLDKLGAVEAYDTVTDTWTRRADLPTPRNALSTAVVDGKVYAIGGWGIDRPEGGWESLDKTAVVPDFSTVEVYDPKTDSWATRADMPTARSHMTVSTIGGKIYAIGGGLPPRSRGGAAYLPLLEVYDTATNRWAPAADLPTPRTVPSSIVIDGRIYAMGGAIQPRTVATRDVAHPAHAVCRGGLRSRQRPMDQG